MQRLVIAIAATNSHFHSDFFFSNPTMIDFRYYIGVD
jgi:hypothetical protein